MRHRVKCNDQKQQEINAAGTSSLSGARLFSFVPYLFSQVYFGTFSLVRICVMRKLPSGEFPFLPRNRALCYQISLFAFAAFLLRAGKTNEGDKKLKLPKDIKQCALLSSSLLCIFKDNRVLFKIRICVCLNSSSKRTK